MPSTRTILATALRARRPLGVESTLLHLSDEKFEWLAKQWRLMHPARDEAGAVVSGFAVMRAIIENTDGDGEVVETVAAELTDDELADADASFTSR